MRFLLLLLLWVSSSVYGQEEVPPESDEIESSQEGNLNQNNQDSTVNSNNETTTNNETYNGAGSSGMPVQSAIAPSLMSTGSESCLQSSSFGVQSYVFGATRGSYRLDEECNRRRDSKVLSDLNMKVAAIARMCQSPDIWESMFMSGTPCPILRNGKLIVGKRAYLEMKRNPDIHIPTYSMKKERFNSILGIGGTKDGENAEGNGNGSSLSLSERHRSSLRSDPG